MAIPITATNPRIDIKAFEFQLVFRHGTALLKIQSCPFGGKRYVPNDLFVGQAPCQTKVPLYAA
jgi:hypothetical protein